MPNCRRCLICYQPLDNEHEYHATCSRALFGRDLPPQLDIALADIATLAKQVVNARLTIPGVQAKLSLTFPSHTKRHRLTIVGLWDGLYVLKPPSPQYEELPENEALTMQLAQLCDIDTAQHGLIRLRSGELVYIARRFDRVVTRTAPHVLRLAQEDMCQLSGVLTEHKYRGSTERVAKIIYRYSTDKGLAVQKFFARVLFSFLTGNSDMHLKNYSLLTGRNNTVQLSPAYDLLSTQLSVPEDLEESALTIHGKKHKLTRQDFLQLAEHIGIPPNVTAYITTTLLEKIPAMSSLIEQSFLCSDSKQRYISLLHTRSQRLLQ